MTELLHDVDPVELKLIELQAEIETVLRSKYAHLGVNVLSDPESADKQSNEYLASIWEQVHDLVDELPNYLMWTPNARDRETKEFINAMYQGVLGEFIVAKSLHAAATNQYTSTHDRALSGLRPEIKALYADRALNEFEKHACEGRQADAHTKALKALDVTPPSDREPASSVVAPSESVRVALSPPKLDGRMRNMHANTPKMQAIKELSGKIDRDIGRDTDLPPSTMPPQQVKPVIPGARGTKPMLPPPNLEAPPGSQSATSNEKAPRNWTRVKQVGVAAGAGAIGFALVSQSSSVEALAAPGSVVIHYGGNANTLPANATSIKLTANTSQTASDFVVAQAGSAPLAAEQAVIIDAPTPNTQTDPTATTGNTSIGFLEAQPGQATLLPNASPNTQTTPNDNVTAPVVKTPTTPGILGTIPEQPATPVATETTPSNVPASNPNTAADNSTGFVVAEAGAPTTPDASANTATPNTDPANTGEQATAPSATTPDTSTTSTPATTPNSSGTTAETTPSSPTETDGSFIADPTADTKAQESRVKSLMQSGSAIEAFANYKVLIATEGKFKPVPNPESRSQVKDTLKTVTKLDASYDTTTEASQLPLRTNLEIALRGVYYEDNDDISGYIIKHANIKLAALMLKHSYASIQAAGKNGSHFSKKQATDVATALVNAELFTMTDAQQATRLAQLEKLEAPKPVAKPAPKPNVVTPAPNADADPFNIALYNGSVLSTGELQKIASLKPIYEAGVEQAYKDTGVKIPWQFIAVLHDREHSLTVDNPDNGQGPYQFYQSQPGTYPPGPITMEQFKQDTIYAAKRIATDYMNRGTVNGGFYRADGSLNMDKVGDTFFSYNGRGDPDTYPAQAIALGYTDPAKQYEGSPYVVNLATDRQNSERNPNWKQYLVDGGGYGPANEVPGALLMFRDLVNISNSSEKQVQTQQKTHDRQVAALQKAHQAEVAKKQRAEAATKAKNEKKAKLTSEAIDYSWHDGPHGPDDKPPAYAAAQQKLAETSPGFSIYSNGADCGNFVGTVVRGVDSRFPALGTSKMQSYMEQNPRLYQEVANHGAATKLDPSEVYIFVVNQDGGANGNGHIWIRIHPQANGKDVVGASQDDQQPFEQHSSGYLNSDGTSYDDGRGPYKIFRVLA
jgi:hypothetical protein